jgi:hypothetical protein
MEYHIPGYVKHIATGPVKKTKKIKMKKLFTPKF